MSLLSKIKAFFNKAVKWFNNLITENDTLTKKYVPVAIDVCNEIKEFNSSTKADALETITSVVSGKWGSVIASLVRSWITNNIDKVITGLNVAENVAEATTVSEKIVLVSNYVQTLDLDNKSTKITTIAAMLSHDLDDSKLSLAEIAAIVTAIYKTN